MKVISSPETDCFGQLAKIEQFE